MIKKKKICDICGDEIKKMHYSITLHAPMFDHPAHYCEDCSVRWFNIVRENPDMTFTGTLEEFYDMYQGTFRRM